MYPKIFLSFLLTVALTTLAGAQSFFDRIGQHLHPRIEIGGHFGTSGYLGDINSTLFGSNGLSGGLGAKYYLNPIHEQDRTWGIRFDVNYIQIKGSDSKGNSAQQDRNMQFTNNIIEFAPAMEFHWWEFRSNRTRTLYSPYVFAGIGALLHDPKTIDTTDPDQKVVSLIDEKVEFRTKSDGTTRPLKKFVPYGNIGVGIKMNLSKSLAPWSIGAEVNYRYAWSNFLDGVGNRHYEPYDKLFAEPLFADPSNPTPDETASHVIWSGNKDRWESLAGPNLLVPYDDLVTQGYKRGESQFNDSYVTIVFRVTYTLYKWRDPQWK